MEFVNEGNTLTVRTNDLVGARMRRYTTVV